MEIIKKYRDSNNWENTTEEECLEHTEGCEYWKKGTVLKMLSEGLMVWTPSADYRKKDELRS